MLVILYRNYIFSLFLYLPVHSYLKKLDKYCYTPICIHFDNVIHLFLCAWFSSPIRKNYGSTVFSHMSSTRVHSGSVSVLQTQYVLWLTISLILNLHVYLFYRKDLYLSKMSLFGQPSYGAATSSFGAATGIKFYKFLLLKFHYQSDCQCTSCNGPGFDPSIRRHSGIWGAADEAVLNIVWKKIPRSFIRVKGCKKTNFIIQKIEREKMSSCQLIFLP